MMKPSAIFAPCERCGIFPGARHGYKCLCHQRPGDPAYDEAVALDEQRRAFDAPLGVPTYPPKPCPADPEYADVDTDGQLAVGIVGDQRAIPGLAKPRKES